MEKIFSSFSKILTLSKSRIKNLKKIYMKFLLIKDEKFWDNFFKSNNKIFLILQLIFQTISLKIIFIDFKI